MALRVTWSVAGPTVMHMCRDTTLGYGVGGDSTGRALEHGDKRPVEIGVYKEAILNVDSRRTKVGPGGAQPARSSVSQISEASFSRKYR